METASRTPRPPLVAPARGVMTARPSRVVLPRGSWRHPTGRMMRGSGRSMSSDEHGSRTPSKSPRNGPGTAKAGLGWGCRQRQNGRHGPRYGLPCGVPSICPRSVVPVNADRAARCPGLDENHTARTSNGG
jgi:hypothetical protein